jgi:hypothetical protein
MHFLLVERTAETLRRTRLEATKRRVAVSGTHADGYRVVWYEGETRYEVRASAKRETWTVHDPELREREYLSQEQRRELFAP